MFTKACPRCQTAYDFITCQAVVREQDWVDCEVCGYRMEDGEYLRHYHVRRTQFDLPPFHQINHYAQQHSDRSDGATALK
ncbi:MAG: hypothetical protein U0Z53_28925 [Blastocatellia bacterium]